MPRKKPAFKLTPPDPSEDQFQHAIANLLDSILPADQVAWSHFPAGGYFLSPAARARLYRLGLKRGFPDIVICYAPARILWLEVKTLTGVISPAQRATHLLLRQLGHTVAVVRRIEQVIAVLMEYQVPFRRARLDGEWYARTQAVASATEGEPAQLQEGASEAA